MLISISALHGRLRSKIFVRGVLQSVTGALAAGRNQTKTAVGGHYRSISRRIVQRTLVGKQITWDLLTIVSEASSKRCTP